MISYLLIMCILLGILYPLMIGSNIKLTAGQIKLLKKVKIVSIISLIVLVIFSIRINDETIAFMIRSNIKNLYKPFYIQ